MEYQPDKWINQLAGSEYGESDPSTRLKNYFAEMAAVNALESDGATVFIIDPQLLETNPGLADLVLPEEVEKFNHLFSEMLMGVQAEPEMSMAELVQRAMTGQAMGMGEKAKQAVQAMFHASQKLIERVQAAALAQPKGKPGFSL